MKYSDFRAPKDEVVQYKAAFDLEQIQPLVVLYQQSHPDSSVAASKLHAHVQVWSRNTELLIYSTFPKYDLLKVASNLSYTCRRDGLQYKIHWFSRQESALCNSSFSLLTNHFKWLKATALWGSM